LNVCALSTTAASNAARSPQPACGVPRNDLLALRIFLSTFRYCRNPAGRQAASNLVDHAFRATLRSSARSPRSSQALLLLATSAWARHAFGIAPARLQRAPRPRIACAPFDPPGYIGCAAVAERVTRPLDHRARYSDGPQVGIQKTLPDFRRDHAGHGIKYVLNRRHMRLNSSRFPGPGREPVLAPRRAALPSPGLSPAPPIWSAAHRRHLDPLRDRIDTTLVVEGRRHDHRFSGSGTPARRAHRATHQPVSKHGGTSSETVVSRHPRMDAVGADQISLARYLTARRGESKT